MRPKELIPILSEFFGVSFETAWVLDRALADAGLRTKSKGRKPLDMTRRDAIHFLLACMSANIATRAVEDVKHWAAFTWKPDDPECNEVGSAEESEHAHALAALSHRADVNAPEDEPAYKEYPMGYKAALCDPLRKLAAADGSITLVDYLLLLTRWLANHGPDPSDVKFELITTHDTARVSYEKTFYGTIHSDHFFWPRGAERRGTAPEQTGIYKGAHIFGDALLAIASRTDDPLAEVLSDD
jgi:hypothetical protein